MTDAELQTFKGDRYQKMLGFYDLRATQNKRWFRILSIYGIAGSFALAPIVAYDLGGWRVLATALSATIGLSFALLSHFKFHENWLRYRSAWDCLMREPSLHGARIGEYKGHADPNALFVERTEAIFAKEGAEWLAVHACEEDAKSSKKP